MTNDSDTRISAERLAEIARGVWTGGSYATLDEQQAMAAQILASRHPQPVDPAEWQVEAAKWLDEAAGYFGRRPTGGEDIAFWANIANAKFCEGLATRLRAASIPKGE